MQRKLVELKSIKQTGKAMENLVREFHSDVSFLDGKSIEYCFNQIKNLKYIPDPQGIESIQRPAFSFSNQATFRDCDDKAVCLGACLYRRGVPFKFVAVSERPYSEVHHVLIFVRTLDAGDVVLDCTYPENKYLGHSDFYKVVPITKEIFK